MSASSEGKSWNENPFFVGWKKAMDRIWGMSSSHQVKIQEGQADISMDLKDFDATMDTLITMNTIDTLTTLDTLKTMGILTTMYTLYTMETLTTLDTLITMDTFLTMDIMTTMETLTKRLEVTLGPDTGDLAVRIGLHSGPVTAGVLRGERARFQLFGDTMNTAAVRS